MDDKVAELGEFCHVLSLNRYMEIVDHDFVVFRSASDFYRLLGGVKRRDSGFCRPSRAALARLCGNRRNDAIYCKLLIDVFDVIAAVGRIIARLRRR